MECDDGNYSPSDSDDEYNENEKLLLNKVHDKHEESSDSEKEVFGVGASSDSEDDKSDLALSDIDDTEDDNVPHPKAWGKDKRRFYKTDYVDADYGGFQGKDARLAELEEVEARNLQKQLAEQLDDDDFALQFLSKKTTDVKEQIEEVVKTDISKLSSRQQLEILEKDSPEFFSLIKDFEEKMTIAKDFLQPVLQKYKKGQIPNCNAIDFVQTYYELILNYSTNIYMYLLLKSSRASVHNHPVIKKLYQYRQLLLQAEPIFDEIIKMQIEFILKESYDSNVEEQTKMKKKLKLLDSITNTSKKEKKHVQFVEDESRSKKIKLDKSISNKKEGSISDDDEEKQIHVQEEVEETDTNEVERRAITYKMAKNKGLTPHRKKEQRNPRVKHKLKYRKAIIRRKGAVREPRKELKRYGGEISGIKTSVTKSIKIKT